MGEAVHQKKRKQPNLFVLSVIRQHLNRSFSLFLQIVLKIVVESEEKHGNSEEESSNSIDLHAIVEGNERFECFIVFWIGPSEGVVF